MNIKKLLIIYLHFVIHIFKIWCVFYTYSTSKFGQSHFKCSTATVATIVHNKVMPVKEDRKSPQV